ncbi:hypothetical protein [Streptomyces zhihengii]
MHRFTVDYNKDETNPRSRLHRGYFIHQAPRIMPLCRLLGHKAMVDGYDRQYGDRERVRWVVCDRCGVRPEPQGFLDADEWNLGQQYTGPMTDTTPPPPSTTLIKQLARKQLPMPRPKTPGPWPARPTGAFGAELVIGKSSTIGFGLKVGNAGSEHVLAAHIGLGPLGALFIHTERFGQGIQRRLNPTGYDSREVDLAFHHGKAWWTIWGRRDEHSTSDPKWMRGNININPAHYLLGPSSGETIQETETAPTTVRMPDGATYDVTVKLEKWQHGRPRGRKTTHWALNWSSTSGIPTRNHSWKGDNTLGGYGPFPDAYAGSPHWVELASAQIAADCMKDRARYGYRAPEAA